MSWTFRPLNRCRWDGYTWHPRGKDRSLKCPKCGRSDIEIVPPSVQRTGCGCLAILLIVGCCLIGLWYWSSDRPEITENDEQKQAKSLDVGKVVVAEKKEKVEPELKEEEKKTAIVKL